MTLVVLASTIAASPARAQEQAAQEQTVPVPAASSAPAVEITPFVALGSTRSSRVGGAVSFPVSSRVSIESEFGYHREAGIDALSSSANILYALPRVGRVTPYLAAGSGLEQHAAPLVTPGSGIVSQSRLASS